MPTMSMFRVRSDDGTFYTVVETESRVRATNLESTQEEFIPGQSTFRLTDGTPLKLRQDGALELPTGSVLWRA